MVAVAHGLAAPVRASGFIFTNHWSDSRGSTTVSQR